MRPDVEAAVAALQGDGVAVVPTDTVYGLACTAYREAPARRLYALKSRDLTQPTAVVAASVDLLLECVPELRGRAGTLARALLPGPLTLVLPNPACRFRWLNGGRPDTIGVRVPVLSGPGAEVLDRVGALAATSANLAGGADPRRIDDVPEELLASVDAVVDGGELPGVPSTVVDLTGGEPRVLRQGAVPAAEVLERAAAALHA
jgi:L-threonylcarbamoyladenylate synthase